MDNEVASPVSRLERSIARRLVAHLRGGTTDMVDDVYEVPTSNYTSAERHRAELDALFLGEPIVLCLSGAVPDPGSFLTVDLCDTPLIVTRDADGIVHSYANVCRHRGVRLVDGVGSTRRFTCPFPRGHTTCRGRSSVYLWPTGSNRCVENTAGSSNCPSTKVTE